MYTCINYNHILVLYVKPNTFFLYFVVLVYISDAHQQEDKIACTCICNFCGKLSLPSLFIDIVAIQSRTTGMNCFQVVFNYFSGMLCCWITLGSMKALKPGFLMLSLLRNISWWVVCIKLELRCRDIWGILLIGFFFPYVKGITKRSLSFI